MQIASRKQVDGVEEARGQGHVPSRFFFSLSSCLSFSSLCFSSPYLSVKCPVRLFFRPSRLAFAKNKNRSIKREFSKCEIAVCSMLVAFRIESRVYGSWLLVGTKREDRHRSGCASCVCAFVIRDSRFLFLISSAVQF